MVFNGFLWLFFLWTFLCCTSPSSSSSPPSPLSLASSSTGHRLRGAETFDQSKGKSTSILSEQKATPPTNDYELRKNYQDEIRVINKECFTQTDDRPTSVIPTIEWKDEEEERKMNEIIHAMQEEEGKNCEQSSAVAGNVMKLITDTVVSPRVDELENMEDVDDDDYMKQINSVLDAQFLYKKYMVPLVKDAFTFENLEKGPQEMPQNLLSLEIQGQTLYDLISNSQKRLIDFLKNREMMVRLCKDLSEEQRKYAFLTMYDRQAKTIIKDLSEEQRKFASLTMYDR